MRAPFLYAWLAAAATHFGCREIGGLDGLHFDTPAPVSDQCGDPLPAGWSGPVVVYEGPQGPVPACPSDYPTVLFHGISGLQAPPAQCASCTCSTPTTTCSLQPVMIFTQAQCHGTPTQMLPAAEGTCLSVAGMGDIFSQDSPMASAGACTPDGGAAELPPLTWAAEGVGCGLGDAGVVAEADGGLCAPRPAAPFAGRWCVFRAGATQCPPDFPVVHLWETIADGRGCSPCTCRSAMATCTGTTVLYSDTACTSVVADLTAGACTQQSGVSAFLATTTAGPSTCPPMGGSPIGKVQADRSMTFCCPE
jgi:hypothetical protein